MPSRLLIGLLVALLFGGPLLARPADARTTVFSVAAADAPAVAAVPVNAPRLLVRFAPSASVAARAAAVAAVGGTIDRDLPALGVSRIALTDEASDLFGDTFAAVAVLQRDPAVAQFLPEFEQRRAEHLVGLKRRERFGLDGLYAGDRRLDALGSRA